MKFIGYEEFAFSCRSCKVEFFNNTKSVTIFNI